MLDYFGKSYLLPELLEYVGHSGQLYGVRRFTLSSGCSKGL
jgi:hypothetical protein